MTDIRELIGRFASEEAGLGGITFIAPRVPRSPVRTRIGGMIYTFDPLPENFSGWGIFRPRNSASADLIRKAGRSQIDSYLGLFPRIRLRLAVRLGNAASWLASPVNRSDAVQRLGSGETATVHLVSDADRFDVITARYDGASLWFEERDMRSDPLMEEYLRAALRDDLPPDNLSKKGLTPEDRCAYETAFWGDISSGTGGGRADLRRIEQALKRGGGRLIDLCEDESYWRVEWGTADGERHSSCIAKGTLNVISAGICLSGHDSRFDLQSLVGVVEARPEWMR